MFRKIPISFLIVILIIVVLLVLRFTGKKQSQIIINRNILTVEIADNDKERFQGLSGRSKLPAYHGMLFIFPQKTYQKFWMKDMLFPLDIIWISNDKIVGFSENLLPEGSDPINIYSSPLPVDKVLEINAGSVKEFNFKTDDVIKYNL